MVARRLVREVQIGHVENAEGFHMLGKCRKEGGKERRIVVAVGRGIPAETAVFRPVEARHHDLRALLRPPLREQVRQFKIADARRAADIDEPVKPREVEAIPVFRLGHADALDGQALRADGSIERWREHRYVRHGLPALRGGADIVPERRIKCLVKRCDAARLGDTVAVDPLGDDEVALVRRAVKDGQHVTAFTGVSRFFRVLRPEYKLVGADGGTSGDLYPESMVHPCGERELLGRIRQERIGKDGLSCPDDIIVMPCVVGEKRGCIEFSRQRNGDGALHRQAAAPHGSVRAHNDLKGIHGAREAYATRLGQTDVGTRQHFFECRYGLYFYHSTRFLYGDWFPE